MDAASDKDKSVNSIGGSSGRKGNIVCTTTKVRPECLSQTSISNLSPKWDKGKASAEIGRPQDQSREDVEGDRAEPQSPRNGGIDIFFAESPAAPCLQNLGDSASIPYGAFRISRPLPSDRPVTLPSLSGPSDPPQEVIQNRLLSYWV